MWSPERQAGAVPIRLTADPDRRYQHVVVQWADGGLSTSVAGRLRHRRPSADFNITPAGRPTRLSADRVTQVDRSQAEATHQRPDGHFSSKRQSQRV